MTALIRLAIDTTGYPLKKWDAKKYLKWCEFRDASIMALSAYDRAQAEKEWLHG